MGAFTFFGKGARSADEIADLSRGIRGNLKNIDISAFKITTNNTDKLRTLAQQANKNPDLAAKLKNLKDTDKLKVYDDIAKNAGKPADNVLDAAKQGDDVLDATTKANRSLKLSRNAKRALAGGVAVGGLVYIERKFKNSKEDIKDCMKVCLPTNWDDFEYGSLDKSELQYKTLDDNEGQPVCSESMEDCGKFCGDKCEEIHEYDVPGTNLLKGTANAAGDVAGSVFKSLFGGLFKGLGLDGSTGMIVSGVCLCLLFSLALYMFLK